MRVEHPTNRRVRTNRNVMSGGLVKVPAGTEGMIKEIRHRPTQDAWMTVRWDNGQLTDINGAWVTEVNA